MRMKGKKLICLTLAGILAWTVPAQVLTAEAAQESREQTAAENTVSGSDAEAAEESVMPLTGNSAEEYIESVDVSDMLYQAGGFGTSVQENDGIAVYAMTPQEELKQDILRALESEEATLDISEYGISTENAEELKALIAQVINENPKLFYVNGSFGYGSIGTNFAYIQFSYREVTDGQKEAFTAKLTEAVSLVTAEMSDEEKALVLHDYLAQHCAYAYKEYSEGTLDSNSDVYNAYGALVDGKAVCQGYSEAYMALLQEVGIQSYICSSDDMNHAWNVVLIDGNWYHVDVTWDDPVWNKEGRALHTFFLLSDAEMENRGSGEGENHHDWVDSVDCDSTIYDSASYWWSGVNSQIVRIGHQDYIYVEDLGGKFRLVRRTDGAETALYTCDTRWNVWNDASYYTTAYAFLSRLGNRIYFNDNLNVYSLDLSDLDNPVPETEYTYAEDDGYIYGAMVYEDGTARLNIDTKPNGDDSYTTVRLREIVSVTGVTLDRSAVSLKEGETLKLTAAVTPDNAENSGVRWSSDDPETAAVAEDGTVTAVKSGTAVITVTIVDGGKTASCTVTVVCSHVMNETEAKSPTCAEEGNIPYWTCSRCNKIFSDEEGEKEITAEDTVLPVSENHGETELRNEKEAEEGKEGYSGDTYCTVCGNLIKEGEIIPALPHTQHVMTKVDAVNPTCGTPGNVAYWFCSICEKNFIDEEGKTEAIEIVTPPTGNHKNTVKQNAVPATEDSEGYTGDIYCNDCGRIIETGTVIPKLPHTHLFTVKTEAVAASCETDGNVEYWTCSKCGKTYADKDGEKELTDVVIRATGHIPGAWNSDESGHWKICTVCGKEIDRAGHTFRWVVDKAATEDETGSCHEECVCGVRRSENTEIPKLDHVHTGILHHDAVAATCIAGGNVEYWTCSGAKCAGKYYADSACQIAYASIETPVVPGNHVGEGYWSKDNAGHRYTCICGTVTVNGAHVYGSDEDSDCDLCGYKRFYVVTGGANAVYEAGSETGLTITADGEFKLFRDVLVDGKTVDRGNYEVRSGSTVVTLKKAYLDTLSAGNHEIRVLYTDGKTALTQFTLLEKADTGNDNDDDGDSGTHAAPKEDQRALSPQTGEPEQSIQWETAMALCAALIAVILIYKRKEVIDSTK